MTTLFFGAIYLLTITPYWVIVTLIGAAILWEVVLRWQIHFKPVDPYQQQLAMGSHGAAFIILTPLIVSWAEHQRLTYYLPPAWVPFVWPAAFAFMGFGAYWLGLSYSRTRMYKKDAQLITRSVIKLLIGIGVMIGVLNRLIIPHDWPAQYRGYAAVALGVLALWLMITAITKLVLLVRPFPWEWERAATGGNQKPYGTSGFAGDNDEEDASFMPYGDSGFAGGRPANDSGKKRFGAGWHWR